MNELQINPAGACVTHSTGLAVDHEMATLSANKRRLMLVLRLIGAAHAVVHYEGFGDSGGVETVDVQMCPGHEYPKTEVIVPMLVDAGAFNAEKRCWDHREVMTPMSLDHALREFAAQAVDQHFSGYENNGGGRGDVTFNVEEDRVLIEHDPVYEETTRSEVTL